MKAERHGNQLPQTVETRWRVLDDRQNGLDRVTIRERVYPEAQAQLQPGNVRVLPVAALRSSSSGV
jgi:hypothetical protein